jgi:hypothetical protein
MGLRLQDMVVATVPPPRPGLVGPGEAEGKIQFRRIEDEVGGRLEKLLAVETNSR